MEKLTYEDIDLFYYHSIDFDFARFASILEYGIVSKNLSSKIGLKYYYRNYTNPSTKNDYISVNHFPRTIFRYCQVENELYDFNRNKICFVIDDIEPLEKQSCRSYKHYTNERHVKDIIEPDKIRGIVLRESDANKKLSDYTFNYKFTDRTYLENKIFSTIRFFTDTFGTFGNTDKLYYLIGKLREAEVLGLDEEVIIEMIVREIKNNIILLLTSQLNIENPTLLDVIKYFNRGKYPIYIMNRFDIKEAGQPLIDTDPRIAEYKAMTGFTISDMKKKKSIDRKTLKLLKDMSDYGLDVYYGYSQGPLTKEDYEVTEKIKKLSFTKKTK